LVVLLAILVFHLHTNLRFTPDTRFSLLFSFATNYSCYNESNERIKEKAQEEESPETAAVLLGIAANKHTQQNIEC